MPTLAEKVARDLSMNLQGIAVGNGFSNQGMIFNSVPYFLYYHGFVGEEEWEIFLRECCPANSKQRCDYLQAGQTSTECE